MHSQMKHAKILFYDLETGPNLAYVWGKYQQDVIAFKEEWELLSFSYKWLGEDEVYAYGQNIFTEKELVLKLHELFDTADIIVAHNGDSFDKRMANAKFLEYGLTPPSPYRTIDTKKVAKRYFRLNSNKLDDLGRILGLGRKVQTGGFDLWLGCLNGDEKSWNKMLRYNKQDTKLLEKIYLIFRPWIENHPAINVLEGSDGCPKCGCPKLQKRGTRKINKTTTVQRFQCTGCGGWCQSRYSVSANIQYVN